ncbi:MAG: glycosyltransferase [Clostridia bacterium]|nr:glycosyltransferase [Clostridia bacterium]
MKKIIFGITSLQFGGAERVLVDIVNKLYTEFDITIFTIYSNAGMEKQLNSNIKIQSLFKKKYEELNKVQKLLISMKLLLLKKQIYNKQIRNNYDVEIAFLEGPITRLFACENRSVKKIAWIHNDITKVYGTGLKANLKKKADKKAYNVYDKLVFVSRDNKEKFEDTYNLDNDKYVIYNYIDIDKVIEKSNEYANVPLKDEEFNIISVARLVKQKAIDRLIKVHSKLIKNGLNHNIYIIGDGPEKEYLQNLIEEKKVGKSFILLGQKENPYPFIKKADCFALLSNYEGYPMVLLEAQILEKFIIITDTSARETLQNYNNRMILDNDEEAIYIGLSKLLKNKEEYLKTNYNLQNYNNLEILEQIKKIIKE